MNRLPLPRRVQIINCLVEGNSIRSTERMTGSHRDTICRLLVEVGDGCAKLMDAQMRELPCRRIEVDEIWPYVGKKQRHMTPLGDPRRVGDQYTFVALDPETKIALPLARIDLGRWGYNAWQGEAAVAKMPVLRMAIVKRSDDMSGFVVLPRRWVVERTFSWFGRNRRLAKDFENLAETLATFVTIASIQLAIRRPARA